MENNSITVGFVIAVHQSKGSCDVELLTGGVVRNVGIMNFCGGVGYTDLTPMPTFLHSMVALLYTFGRWYVLGTLPTNYSPGVNVSVSPTYTETGTDNNSTYGAEVPTEEEDYAMGRTTAYLPSDKIMSATGGAELLLGAEGLAVLKASPLAQIVLGALKDFCKIIAREFSIYSDFGELSFTGGGPSGTTGMVIKGGSSFCDEAGTHDPIYPVKIYIGTVPGDPIGRFGMHVTDANNGNYVRIDVDNAGNLTINTSVDETHTIKRHLINTIEADQVDTITGVRNTIIKGTPPDTTPSYMKDNEFMVDHEDTQPDETVSDSTVVELGDRTVTLLAGNQTHTIVGNEETTVTGRGTRIVNTTETHQVGASEEHTIGSDYNLTAGFITINSGGILFNTIGGASNTVKMSPVNIIQA